MKFYHSGDLQTHLMDISSFWWLQRDYAAHIFQMLSVLWWLGIFWYCKEWLMWFLCLIRPLSAPHDLMQLCGRGGRGPNVFTSTLEVIWNNNDIAVNVPGMSINAFISKNKLVQSLYFTFTNKITWDKINDFFQEWQHL